MTEAEANLVMDCIERLSSDAFDVWPCPPETVARARAMLKHLYEIHEIRDWRFYLDVTGPILDPKEWYEVCEMMREMI